MNRLYTKPYLCAELLVMMVGVPALLYYVLPIKYLLPTIWAAAFYAYGMTRLTVPGALREWWVRTALTRANLKPILLRFAVCALLLTGATWLFKPELLFSFVREKPLFWLFVMIAYPILSVIPQEIIFRSFFFQRYKPIFPDGWVIVLASGLSFGLAHILFHNWVAPVLCMIGGIMFAQTYRTHGSLLLVALEHALYGDFLFTVGLGRYFYHGSVAAAL